MKRYRVILEVEADSEEAIEFAMDECPYDNADEVEPKSFMLVEEIEDDE